MATMRSDRAGRRMIGVALGPKTMAEALAALARVAAEADLAELRLDLFEQPYELATLLRERTCPVVATLRARGQGGRSEASAPERLAILRRAAELGADYVDLEWDAATPAALAALRAAGAQVIVSRHDFAAMPDDLAEGWWPELAALGADVVKVVGLARDARDCLPVFRAFRQADRPTVAIAMGEPGLATRVLALREEHCLLTYASLSADAPVAPGQVTVAAMREVYHAERLTPRTATYGLLGRQPDVAGAARFNVWFAAAELDAVAVPFVTDDAPGTVSAFRELPVAGWHVQGDELQSTVGQALDELAPAACRRGKVNAIVAQADVLRGDWVESPEGQLELWTGQSPTPFLSSRAQRGI